LITPNTISIQTPSQNIGNQVQNTNLNSVPTQNQLNPSSSAIISTPSSYNQQNNMNQGINTNNQQTNNNNQFPNNNTQQQSNNNTDLNYQSNNTLFDNPHNSSLNQNEFTIPPAPQTPPPATAIIPQQQNLYSNITPYNNQTIPYGGNYNTNELHGYNNSPYMNNYSQIENNLTTPKENSDISSLENDTSKKPKVSTKDDNNKRIKNTTNNSNSDSDISSLEKNTSKKPKISKDDNNKNNKNEKQKLDKKSIYEKLLSEQKENSIQKKDHKKNNNEEENYSTQNQVK
jgi:hypothetical protein